jgi:heme-degrading monooxygenase HmoA
MQLMKRMLTTASVLYLFILVNTAMAQNTVSMNKNTSYSVEIIRYTVAGNQRAEFEDAYAKAGAILQKSPYCLGYEIIHGVDESQHYMVRIHWTSVQDHMNGFRKSKEFSSFFNLVKPFYNNIEEMKHYELTETVWMKE